MASITTIITDLDDLLYQFSNITASAGNITITTTVAHNITFAAGMKFAVSGTTAFDGEYDMASATGSTIVLTASGITATETSGQGFVNNIANDSTYFTQEIVLDFTSTTSPTFTLNAAGNLSDAGSGVTGQALYSFFKERWKEVPSLTKFKFPMLSITNEQFEIYNGWRPANDATRKKIRTAGWAEVDNDGLVSRRYFGLVSLGTLNATDAPYYVQNDSFTASTATTTYTGAANEPIQFYGNENTTNADTTAGDFGGASFATDATVTDIVVATKTVTTSAAHGMSVGDLVLINGTANTSNHGYYTIATVPSTTTFTIVETFGGADETGQTGTASQKGYNLNSYYKIFVRTRGYTYTSSSLTDIGVSSLTYIVYRFPLSNASDLNINTTADGAFAGATIATIDGDATTITVTTSTDHGLYAGAPVTITGTTNYNGSFTVAGITSSTVYTISSADHNFAVENTGTSKLRWVEDIKLTYLVNPDTSTGNVRIRGDWVTGTTYNLGDVVRDGAAADPNKKWYYLNATTGDSTGANLSADTNNTWTLWNTVGINGERNIEEDSATVGTWSAYSAIFDLADTGNAAAATKEVAYEYAQYLLRQSGTIDVGASRNGEIADTIVYFVGSQLHSYANPSNQIGGVTYPYAVAVDWISSTDVNNITYHDYADATHFAPTVVLVTINFNNNLYNDTNSVFYAYYTGGTASWGTAGAVQVQQSNSTAVGSEISNNIPDGGQYTFNYSYTADTTNGRTGDTDTNITVVAIGLDTGQYVTAAQNITSTGATISLVAPLERNYTDPNG